MRKPNINECDKDIGNINCDIEASYNAGAHFESYDDRACIELTCIISDVCTIDLEDVLRFAAKNCRGIYERVLTESRPTPYNYDSNGIRYRRHEG